jgi:carboxymethylenebutenolidase
LRTAPEDSMGSFATLDTGNATPRLYAAGEGKRSAGVLVLHPWWGLNDDVIAFADRLSEEGFTVTAPDMFGGQVATTVDQAEKLAKGADEAAVDGIVRAALDDLATRVQPDAKLGALGFSFGAHWAMRSPVERDRVVASVLYYGTTGDFLTEASVPVLGHFAADDPYETTEWVSEFEETLKSAGRDVRIHRYPDTGHWFAEPSKDAYRPDAANLAFDRTVEFLKRELAAPE